MCKTTGNIPPNDCLLQNALETAGESCRTVTESHCGVLGASTQVFSAAYCSRTYTIAKCSSANILNCRNHRATMQLRNYSTMPKKTKFKRRSDHYSYHNVPLLSLAPVDAIPLGN